MWHSMHVFVGGSLRCYLVSNLSTCIKYLCLLQDPREKEICYLSVKAVSRTPKLTGALSWQTALQHSHNQMLKRVQCIVDNIHVHNRALPLLWANMKWEGCEQSSIYAMEPECWPTLLATGILITNLKKPWGLCVRFYKLISLRSCRHPWKFNVCVNDTYWVYSQSF